MQSVDEKNFRKDIKTRLETLLEDKKNRVQLLREFQEWVWQGGLPGDEQWEFVQTLAYDLDYYEPDPVERMWEASFFDDSKFDDEVRQALARLASTE